MPSKLLEEHEKTNLSIVTGIKYDYTKDDGVKVLPIGYLR